MAWLSRRTRRSAGIALLLLSCAAPGAAQSAEELARARTVYNQGLSLEAAGDWAGALAKFEEVARVKLTPQVRYHIARSKEHLGRLTEALGDYRLAEYEAQQAGAKELGEITRAREALEARVPKLVITRGRGAAGARIELDGVAVGEAQVGKQVNVDPGPHRIVAKLPSGSFEQTVEVSEGETKDVELVPPEGQPTEEQAAATVPRHDDIATTTVDTSGSAAPWIIGGIGVASLAASGVFFLLRHDAESELDDVCRGDVCPERLRETEDNGKLYSMVGNITLGVGIVGIGIATVLLISGGGSEDAPAEQARRLPVSRVDVAASGGFQGVQVSGSF